MKRQWKKELPRTRNYGIILAYLGIVTLLFYPVGIHPMLFPDKYREIQKETRRNINQEDIQPGGMRLWRDPFDRKKGDSE